MILPSPFCVLVLETADGSARFHEALAALERQPRPPWAEWILTAISRTRTDVPDGDDAAWARTLWFRLEGRGEATLPRTPHPGVRLYRPGDDAPITIDPLGAHDAQFILPAALGRFLRTIGVEGGQPVAPVATQATEPEPAPEGAQADPEPEPEPEPEPLDEGGPEPQTEPEPERRPPPQTTTPPVPLVAGASVVVESRLGGSWTTAFVRDGRVIATDDGRVAPWVDPRAPGRLTTVLKSALDRVGVPIERGAVRDAIGDWISALQEVGDGDRVVSAAVSRVIGLTDRVLIEQTRPPTFVITLGDEEFVLTNTEMASNLTKRINELWLGVFYERLGASAHDWDAIRDYWLSIAERGEPWGDRTPYDGVTSALQIRISAEPMFDVREGLIRSGLYRDPSGIIWVNNSVVQEVLSSGVGDLSIAGFSAHLRREGYLVQTSTVHRVGGITVRAWGFAPGFRADEGVSQTSTNTVRGVGMNE